MAVLGNRDPRRSAAVRDEILEELREGTIVARHQRDRHGRASCWSAAARATRS